MSHKSKVHSDSYTKLSVPFQWEKQPGVSISSKPIIEPAKDQPFLPLPPCWSHPNKAVRRQAIISPSKGAFGNQLAGFEKDPFLVAFKECTKPNSDPPKPGIEPRVCYKSKGLEMESVFVEEFARQKDQRKKKSSISMVQEFCRGKGGASTIL